MSDSASLRRWMARWRAVESREREEQRQAAARPAESFAQAMAFIAFAADRHGWPLPLGPEDEAENLAFHEVWARLRRRAAAA